MLPLTYTIIIFTVYYTSKINILCQYTELVQSNIITVIVRQDSSVYSGSVQTMTTAENHNSSTIALDCRVQETTPVCCKTPNQTYNSKNNPEDLLEEFTGKLNAIVKHCPASDFYHRTGTTQSQCNVKVKQYKNMMMYSLKTCND